MRRGVLALAAVAALAAGACGSSDGGGTASSVAPETARQSVERAARVELAAERVPAEAREQGLRASFSNSKTAVKDGQVVALFVLDDDDVAKKVSSMVRRSAPASSRLIVNDTVMVVYASAGSDHAAAVERAVRAL